jgi:protein-glutamine gamma-glutamyltransferase
MAKASPAIDAASRAWSLAATVACVLPLLLQLPSRIAFGVGIVGLISGVVSWRVRIPVWLRLTLSLALVAIVMTSMGMRIGRDTGCALLAAMLAIKPLELHTVRDARSLLGFALFAPFATFLLDQGPWSLLLGLGGALLVLLALLRLSEQESGDARPPSTRGRVRLVLRLVATGLPLALAAFWLFPRIATPLWGVPERALARPGLSDVMSPGEWVDLMGDDRPALRVVFYGATPQVTQMYWRGPVLMDFDGRDWTRSRWLRNLPAPDTTREGATWDYEVEVEPTEQRTLVALELPLATPAGARMAWDYGLSTDRPLASVTRWRMQSSAPQTFEPKLPALLRQAALRLPDGYNPRTVAMAQRWRDELGEHNHAAIVDRAMRMIQSEYGYTLDTPLPGRHSADEFLFDWKRGFCEHFSSSFVILMRAAGVPARVVTGYVGGYRNRFGNYWVVRRMDAHAWAEVWLEGRGWVRVDPTAAVAPERIYDTLEDRVASGLGALPGFAPALDIGDWMRRGWNDFVLGFDAARQRDLFRPLVGNAIGTHGLVALFGIAAVGALAWMLWLSACGARERDPLLRAWHRLGRRYARLGLGRAGYEPALHWVERIAPSLDAATAAALSALSHRFVEGRYAPDAGRAASAPDLVRALRRHRPTRADPPECPP